MDIKKLSFSDLYAAHEMSLNTKKQQAGLFNSSDQEKFLEAIRIEFLRRQELILKHKSPTPKKNELEELTTKILAYFDKLKAKYNVGKAGYPLKVTWQRKQSIKKLLDSGITKDDIRLVMETRFADGGPKESEHQWLTPETMFRPDNFSRYLSQADIIQKKLNKTNSTNWTD